MVIKYNNIFRSKALQNFTQIGIFGLKINHLATLPELIHKIDSAGVDVMITNFGENICVSLKNQCYDSIFEKVVIF
jgi:hypothetical protein